MKEEKKKYVAYDPETFKFIGFYTEGRKTMPTIIAEVDPISFKEDKGQHTHYSPEKGFYTVEVQLSDAEIRAEFKYNREEAIRVLKVEVEGLSYDANEPSRSRVADNIVALEPLETTSWVLADNTVATLSRETLVKVLRAIRTAQGSLWT